jgi:hypothetical protein
MFLGSPFPLPLLILSLVYFGLTFCYFLCLLVIVLKLPEHLLKSPVIVIQHELAHHVLLLPPLYKLRAVLADVLLINNDTLPYVLKDLLVHILKRLVQNLGHLLCGNEHLYSLQCAQVRLSDILNLLKYLILEDVLPILTYPCWAVRNLVAYVHSDLL